MKRYISSIMAIAASFTIISYDGLTGVYGRVKDGSIWPRLTEVYTNQQNKEFYKVSHDAAKFVLQSKYVTAFECASGIPNPGCKKPMKK